MTTPRPDTALSGERPLVDFVIGGVAKSGTTYLAGALAGHPRCDISAVKEPAFFCRQDGWIDGNCPTGPTFSGNHGRGTAWYTSLFRERETACLRGDASTVYFEAEESPALLLEQNPDLKWIVAVREPVARAYAHYWEERKHGLPVGEFARAGDSTCPRVRRVLEVSRYELHLERILRLLPREQLLVVLAEDLFECPESVIDTVCSFLDLPAARGLITERVKQNPGRQPRSKWLARLLVRGSKSLGYGAAAGGPAKALRLVKKALMPLAYTNTPYPPLADTVKRELWASYAPTRAWMRELLGRTLPAWEEETGS